MITTDRNIKHYEYSCEKCGKTTELASNQPTGDIVPVLCECFTACNLEIPAGHKGYKMHASTRLVRKGIINIFRDIQRSMTIRQVFYQAVTRGVIDKTEKGYGVIQRNILDMRRYGHLPYSLIADLSRRMVKPHSYSGLGDALDNWMSYYRQDVWKKQPNHVEVWLEKDALSGIFTEITVKWDVPLFIARGFSSESFLYRAAEEIKRINKPAYVYYFSDYDPSGLAMCDQVKKRLSLFGVDIHFNRVCLTKEQIAKYNLPSRPTKQSRHSKGFDDDSTELDALHPNDLQNMIEGCILKHITPGDLQNIVMEEKVQRDTLKKMKTFLGLPNNVDE